MINDLLKMTTYKNGVSQTEVCIGKLIAMDFEGADTKLTFEVPHGTRWGMGEYAIVPAKQAIKRDLQAGAMAICARAFLETQNTQTHADLIVALAEWEGK